MIVRRICQTVGFAAVCRLKILLDPIYREIIIVGIMLVIGNTAEYLISLAGILRGIIVPDIILELGIGQKQRLSFDTPASVVSSNVSGESSRTYSMFL